MCSSKIVHDGQEQESPAVATRRLPNVTFQTHCFSDVALQGRKDAATVVEIVADFEEEAKGTIEKDDTRVRAGGKYFLEHLNQYR